jgi:hypothetical protein
MSLVTQTPLSSKKTPEQAQSKFKTKQLSSTVNNLTEKKRKKNVKQM